MMKCCPADAVGAIHCQPFLPDGTDKQYLPYPLSFNYSQNVLFSHSVSGICFVLPATASLNTLTGRFWLQGEGR